MCLRCSKRQKIQPDFFVSESSFLNAKSHVTQARTESERKKEVVNSSYINVYESDSDCVILSSWLNEAKKGQKRFKESKVNKKTETSSACKRKTGDKDMRGQVQQSNYLLKKADEMNKSFVSCYSTSVPIQTNAAKVKHDLVSNQNKNFSIKSSMKVEYSSKRKPSMEPSRKFSDKVKKVCLEKRYKERYSVLSSRVPLGAKSYSKIFLSQNESKEIIERCMKNINLEILKHQHSAVQKWEEILSYKWWKLPQTPPAIRVYKLYSPASTFFLLDSCCSLKFELTCFQSATVEIETNSSVTAKKSCHHEYVLNEEIGTICQCCRTVGTEIRHILPSFLNSTGRMRVTEYDDTKSDGRHVGSLDLKELLCLVFVETIIEAKVVQRFMSKLSYSSHLKVSYLTGGGASVDALTLKMQKKTLDSFRCGEVNILFTTDVAEEGIDVANCSNVIRFDLPTTVRSYVQSRGRARQSESSYILMLEM